MTIVFIFSYQACYDYTITNDTCTLEDNPDKEKIYPTYIPDSDGLVYKIEVPVIKAVRSHKYTYFNNKICFFILGKK